MFSGFFKNIKIKRFAKKLPADLKKRYGKKRYYSRLQVDRAIRRQRLRRSNQNLSTNDYYAYAMYCSPQEFARICRSADVGCDYSQMRRDISQVVFAVQSDFSFTALESESNTGSNCDSGGGLGGSDSDSSGDL
ncbi:DUF6559 family protein [Vibrio nereis]|uniref:DUF6559 family protein n=1 Tax=Vibrio nereis TaxID=693 RepID=UPI003CD0DF62